SGRVGKLGAQDQCGAGPSGRSIMRSRGDLRHRRVGAGVVAALALVGSVVVATFTSSAPAGAATPLSLRVAGSHLVDGSGAVVQLRGVNRAGTEYACSQGWGMSDGPLDAASV